MFNAIESINKHMDLIFNCDERDILHVLKNVPKERPKSDYEQQIQPKPEDLEEVVEQPHIPELCYVSITPLPKAMIRKLIAKKRMKALFKCDSCDKSFSTITSVNGHSLSKHQLPVRYKCDMCCFSTTYLCRLDWHKKKVHRLGVRCQVCRGVFIKAQDYTDHIKRHHKNK